MHEIEIIERLRMKRAWEKEMDTTENIEKRHKIITQIENSDWAFREEVHFINIVVLLFNIVCEFDMLQNFICVNFKFTVA